MKKWNWIVIFPALLLLGWGCNQQSVEEARFALLTSSKTGLDFENPLTQTSEFNVFNYMYFFNGGGVAAADFNQDGLPDLYFTANMASNKLFLNKGSLTFEDVTEDAKVAGEGSWKTGVTVVDINQDGLLDIYVSQMGDYQTAKGKNQLFVCQSIENGIPVFEEKASAYGLDLVVFGTQATFFDYDLDGDLDLYLLNHSLHANGTFGQRKAFAEEHPQAGDRLYRNDGGRFKEVSREAGINSTAIGYGLGVVTGDVNLDGWPDIYVGNDFHENDYLYINQQDGTFKEELTDRIRHTSRFSMGVDIADLNNDALPEILSLDMLPEDPFILKSSLAEDSYGLFHFKLGYGYNHQYSRNNLQLNNGDGTFTEIGLFAGIEATDWSWAGLFQDFDHDGYKDLFISNGIPRRMNDIDYVNFRANNEIRWKQQTDNLEETDLVVVEKMPQIKLPNKLFYNAGNLRFRDATDQVIENKPSYSNGAVYADFDLDGDLDIVTNNLEDAPFLYQNLLMEQQQDQPKDYLSFHFEGAAGNLQGIGSKVLLLKQDGQKVFFEYMPVRGYQSASLTPFHVPVGDRDQVRDIYLIWPDNSYIRLDAPQFNQTDTFRYRKGLPQFDWSSLSQKPATPMVFEDVSEATGLDFEHQENFFIEFDREGLIPFMVSAEGPATAVGDLNQDGRADIFFGSSKKNESVVYYQTPNGRFEKGNTPEIWEDDLWEDIDAEIIDLDQDGNQDIVVATGGNEFWDEHVSRRQRVYWNDGKENFISDIDAFGDTYLTAGAVVVADFNQDGKQDVFFGGRAVPRTYGKIPESGLFFNQGNRKFKNVTEPNAPGLQAVGLIRDASAKDLDQDGDMDLLLAMDWGPVVAFMNEAGLFQKKVLWNEYGWWNTIETGDFDGDGDIDLLAAGIGANSKLRPTPEEPVRLYLNDFDNNGKIEQILTYYRNGKEYPFATYAELTTQLPNLKKQYLFAKDLAAAELTELFGVEKLNAAEVLVAEEGRHLLLENTGQLSFKKHLLPDPLQFSFINVIQPLSKASADQFVLGGNFYNNNIEMGRYDAHTGSLLQIGKDLKVESGPLGRLRLDGVVNHIRTIEVGGKPHLLVVLNDAPAQLIRIQSVEQNLTMAD